MQYIYDAIGYIFDPLPPRNFAYYIVLAVIVALLLALSFYIRFYIRKNNQDKTFRRLFRGYPSKLETIAVIIGICLFARYYGVSFLSTRVLLFTTLVIMIWLLYRIVIVYLKTYPAQKKQHHELMERNKYLPKKKHR
jgi:uncharacterized membrane protein SirB2